MAHTFVSYIREDREMVDRLCSELRSRGIEVWLDRDRISPGERWQDAIRRAIENGAHFIACFSGKYFEKEASFMNEELELGIAQLRLRPRHKAWFIPIRLEECDMPDFGIGAGETIRSFQWLDLYKNWKGGIEKIVATITDKRDKHEQTADLKHAYLTFSNERPFSNWAEKEGTRNQYMVRFDTSSSLTGELTSDPPEVYQNHVWTYKAKWLVRVRRVPDPNLEMKRIGIIRSKNLYGSSSSNEGRTLIGEYVSSDVDGVEEWQVCEEWDRSSGSTFQKISLAVVAWYQDGRGNTYYDDNYGVFYRVDAKHVSRYGSIP